MTLEKNIKNTVLNLENTPKSATYRPDIDGIRAIAVLAVVCFHAFPQILPGGFVGVDVFFVISGFLISSIILQGLQLGNFSFSHFYARRIQRIFPALIIVLAACGVFGWFALFPDELKMLGKHMFAGSAFVSNFFFGMKWAISTLPLKPSRYCTSGHSVSKSSSILFGRFFWFSRTDVKPI